MLLVIVVSTVFLTESEAGVKKGQITVVVEMLLLSGEKVSKKNLHISWDAPTHREDGTLLEEGYILTYRIRYKRLGSTQGYRFFLAYPPDVSTRAVLSGKVGEQYEMAISAIGIDGQSSPYSETKLLTIN